MSTDVRLEKISWRDPSGFVCRSEGRIFRAILPAAALNIKTLLNTPWFQRKVSQGIFPRSSWLQQPPVGYQDNETYVWIEHEALEFPAYPHEITAMQLHAAGSLTLEIAEEAHKHGWTMKDASAWNVLFSRGKPVFCDILSFEPLVNNGVWPAYAQFCRHFLIPLLIHKELGIEPALLFTSHRDGVPPESARTMIKGLAAWNRLTFEVIMLPAMLTGLGQRLKESENTRSLPTDLSQYLISRIFRRLGKHIKKVKPLSQRYRSVWSSYEKTRCHYSDVDLQRKHAFVRKALAVSSIKTVLDVGCNAGEFSKIAASLGKSVVAADFDTGALSRLYDDVRNKGLCVTPFLFDVARPTPAIGWMNSETPSFLERAKDKFDCVMILGLIHHLIVSERVPLREFLRLILVLNIRILLVEWIDPADPRFKEISAGNDDLYNDLDSTNFESIFRENFTLISKEALPCGTRTMYQWEKL